ncbi:MAG: GNAT family N-acetyltransferase [Nitrospiraceae bacterium]
MPLKTKVSTKPKALPKVRKSAVTIVYADGTDIPPQHLFRLYQQAPWAKGRTIEDAKTMLKHTDEAVTAWDGERLVGFGRVLTDYVYRATIWDVIVDKAYQGRGVGTAIVNRIVHHPRLKRVELFWLCTRMPRFYERLGFSSREQTGMVRATRKQAKLE